MAELAAGCQKSCLTCHTVYPVHQKPPAYPPECCILDNEKMAKYADQINQGIKENDLPEEREHGLMHWYHPKDDNDELDNKVYSAHCSVEVINGELTGVITAKVMGELSDEALAQFIDYCTGQLSDGWGESLEQKYIRTDIGEVNVSFWSSDDSWSLQTEEEMNNIRSEDITEEPDTGMTM